MVRKFSLAIPSARADAFFLPLDLLGGLRYFLRVSDIHLIICWWSISDLRRPQKVLCFLWDPVILGGTALRLRAMSWEVFYLTSCLIINQRRSYLEIYYLFSDGINLVAVFTLHSVE